jgi:hypothetical protein
MQELHVGDTVKGYFDDGKYYYTAKVLRIDGAYAKVDYSGSWGINLKQNGTWGSDCFKGYIEIIPKDSLQKINQQLAVGDTIAGYNDCGAQIYTAAKVLSVDLISKTAIIDYSGKWYLNLKIDGTWGSSHNLGSIVILNSNQKEKEVQMDALKSYSDNKIQEPTKSFYQAKVTDEKGNLTDMGKNLLLQFLLDRNAAEFKSGVIDPFLAEQEKNKQLKSEN